MGQGHHLEKSHGRTHHPTLGTALHRTAVRNLIFVVQSHNLLCRQLLSYVMTKHNLRKNHEGACAVRWTSHHTRRTCTQRQVGLKHSTPTRSMRAKPCRQTDRSAGYAALVQACPVAVMLQLTEPLHSARARPSLPLSLKQAARRIRPFSDGRQPPDIRGNLPQPRNIHHQHVGARTRSISRSRVSSSALSLSRPVSCASHARARGPSGGGSRHAAAESALHTGAFPPWRRVSLQRGRVVRLGVGRWASS
jgi:hypothetical protein